MTGLQHGAGSMPVYAGTRYQRGGGILDSIAHFAQPIAKRALLETAKTAPSVLADIVLRKQSPATAVVKGLKNVGLTALKAAMHVLNIKGKRKVVGRKRRATTATAAGQRKKKRAKKDIFS